MLPGQLLFPLYLLTLLAGPGSARLGDCVQFDHCATGNPTFSNTVYVDETIVIDRPGTYDFGGVLHIWDGPGTCNQTENQPYILRIASSDVTLKNFAYKNAPDGIHIGTADDGQGHSSGESITNIRLENVVGWACEDALTTQYGVKKVTITNSTFLANPDSAHRDKLLQMNFGDVTINNTTFHGGDDGTCAMFKGGQSIVIEDSCFVDCKRAVNGSTEKGIVGEISHDPSEMTSIQNFGFNRGSPLDDWQFLTADGDVSLTSIEDHVCGAGYNQVEDGATVSVER